MMKNIVSKSVMKQDRERFCRSLDYTLVAGKTNPYALLAAAVIAQAAVDCSEYDPEIESPDSIDVQRKGVNCRFNRLRDFINSDWIDMLLSWQTQVTPEAVCEELVRRLQHETVSI
jgi:hypothetical protein